MRPAPRGTELVARPKPFGVRSLTTERQRPCTGMPRPRKSTKRGINFGACDCGEVPQRQRPAIQQTGKTGILLAGCSLVSRAGASKSPTSPTYQQQTAKMKKKENILRFLLLLFLARRMFALEIRHGDVVAFQLVGAPVNLFNLASGHPRRRGASMFFRRRVHYGLICGPRDFRRSEGRAMMFCQYRFAPGI